MSQLVESLAGQFDKLPPHSIEAEMCMLASMMLDKEIVGQVVQLVDREAFYLADHQVIYDMLVTLYEQNRPIDAVIVRDELRKRGLYEEVGGDGYMGAILNKVPSAAHGVHYAGIVREKSMLRQLISASNDILRDAYAPHEQADLVLDNAEKKIFEIAQKKVSGQMVKMEVVLHEVFEMIENRGQRGLETGFFELDDMMNGLQNGEMVIVAARPSMGKAQPLDARVLTPSGFRPMGELNVGDAIVSPDGQPSQIEGIYPQGERQVYRITLSDGRSTECCAEHLWRVHCRHWDEPRVISTAKIMELLTRSRLAVEILSDNNDADEGFSDDVASACDLDNLRLADFSTLALLERKQARVRTRRLNIAAIVLTRVTQTQCIAVSHPSHLYITDDYIVTHNTAFAMNIIEHVAADSRMPCAVFSLEMSKQQLAQRMLCCRGDIDAHKLRKGMLQAHEYAHLANVVGELAKAPIWVDDSAGLTPLELRAKARRLKLQHDIKCIMIDYMQLMDNPGPESRQQQISEISRGVKSVARELNIPVICLSQLNRASEGRDGHRPRMSDLRESGSIEQDADVVMLLHREDYYRMAEPDFQPDNIAEVIIAKQRNGPTGTVKLTFLNKTTRFANLSTASDPFA